MPAKLKVQPEPLAQEQLRDDYLRCRTLGHAWDEVVADDLEAPGDGWRYSLQCYRCVTRRHDVISFKTGDLVRRHYDYPEGYEIDEKITRSALRMEIARRREYDFIQANKRRRKVS